jgi:hypothetical protein
MALAVRLGPSPRCRPPQNDQLMTTEKRNAPRPLERGISDEDVLMRAPRYRH